MSGSTWRNDFSGRADLLADDGVLLDNPALFEIERAGLGKNRVGNSDFPDVVDQSSDS